MNFFSISPWWTQALEVHSLIQSSILMATGNFGCIDSRCIFCRCRKNRNNLHLRDLEIYSSLLSGERILFQNFKKVYLLPFFQGQTSISFISDFIRYGVFAARGFKNRLDSQRLWDLMLRRVISRNSKCSALRTIYF